MSRMLLTEFYQLCEGGTCQDLLTEEEKRYVANGGLILSGVMQRAEAQNGNGRVYPMRVLEREVENYKKLVKEKRALGELDHPESSIVNLANASHLVTDVWFEGKDVMGKIKVLETPAGKTLRALVEGGCQVGISSRGLGTVDESNGAARVNDDFQLICFDMVSEPSTPGAYMLKEGKKVSINEMNRNFNKSDRINRIFNDILNWK